MSFREVRSKYNVTSQFQNVLSVHQHFHLNLPHYIEVVNIALFIENFTEILKTLGYRRVVSLESFRQPNFHLVADILIWLVKQFDADHHISDDCSNSDRRVLFIRSVTEFMAMKTGLKLNTKKLYMADGHAVQEMLKIVSLLSEALKMQNSVDEDFCSFTNIDLSAKIQELKLTRELAIQITRKGSSLFDLLSQEPDLRETRIAQANQYIDINEVESIIRNLIDDTHKNIHSKTKEIEEIASKEQALDSKIEAKKNDLKRITQRLEILKGFGPKYSEEYERHEKELFEIYEDYVTKYRCYTYLQQQLQQVLTINQNTAVNVDSNEQDDNLEKMLSLSDDGSLSSGLPTPPAHSNTKKSPGITKKPRRNNVGRIHTAVDPRKSTRPMYGDIKDESDGLDDEDDDVNVNDVDNVESFLNKDDSDEDSDLIPSDLENLKTADDKSDDTF